MASDDSVLQMVTRPSLKLLSSFVGHPTNENASLLVIIPAIYNVLRLEEKRGRAYPSDLLGVCRWLVERANVVLAAVVIHPAPLVDKEIDTGNMDWREVGITFPLHLSLTSMIRLAAATVCHRSDTGQSTQN